MSLRGQGRLKRLYQGMRMGAMALVLGAVAGCGFTPLYTSVEGTGQPVLVQSLSQVRVAPISGRTGQLVYRALQQEIGTRVDGNRFLLKVQPVVDVDGLALESDAAETRFNLTMTAEFELVDQATDEILLTGNTRAVSAYNRTDSRYGTIIAREDAEANASQVVSENIVLRVGAYLRGQQLAQRP